MTLQDMGEATHQEVAIRFQRLRQSTVQPLLETLTLLGHARLVERRALRRLVLANAGRLQDNDRSGRCELFWSFFVLTYHNGTAKCRFPARHHSNNARTALRRRRRIWS